jgi:hypothetical protein
MADLHHRGAFAFPLKQFRLHLGKDGDGQRGRTGAEIESTRHGETSK